jgi:hypothetical protein
MWNAISSVRGLLLSAACLVTTPFCTVAYTTDGMATVLLSGICNVVPWLVIPAVIIVFRRSALATFLIDSLAALLFGFCTLMHMFVVQHVTSSKTLDETGPTKLLTDYSVFVVIAIVSCIMLNPWHKTSVKVGIEFPYDKNDTVTFESALGNAQVDRTYYESLQTDLFDKFDTIRRKHVLGSPKLFKQKNGYHCMQFESVSSEKALLAKEQFIGLLDGFANSLSRHINPGRRSLFVYSRDSQPGAIQGDRMQLIMEAGENEQPEAIAFKEYCKHHLVQGVLDNHGGSY